MSGSSKFSTLSNPNTYLFEEEYNTILLLPFPGVLYRASSGSKCPTPQISELPWWLWLWWPWWRLLNEVDLCSLRSRKLSESASENSLVSWSFSRSSLNPVSLVPLLLCSWSSSSWKEYTFLKFSILSFDSLMILANAFWGSPVSHKAFPISGLYLVTSSMKFMGLWFWIWSWILRSWRPRSSCILSRVSS